MRTTSIEVTGRDDADFTRGDECLNRSLDNRLADSRRSPDGRPFGADTCIDGLVWREVVPSDHVCVTPTTRDATHQDNLLADSRHVHG